MKDSNQKAS